MNYTEYVSAIAGLLAVPSTQTDFVAMLPNIINDAEQRMYRELDLLSTIVRDESSTLTANSRNFTLPTPATGQFRVVAGANVITPSGQSTSTGTRNQLTLVSRDYLDAVWPTETAPTTPSLPVNFAMVTDQTIIVGPSPSASYTVEIIGTIRPTALSVSNTTTYLTSVLPDCFVAASMVFAAGYMKNFGAAADDPKMATTWESHYQTLFSSANVEERRKEWASQAWTPKQPQQISTPPRS